MYSPEAACTIHVQYCGYTLSSGPILNKNMPRVAGMLKWSQELRDRVNSSLNKLKNLDKGY